MSGEKNLKALLRRMQPVLHDAPYGYGVVLTGQPIPQANVFAQIAEAEGTTFVALQTELVALGIAGGDAWARNSLHVHSDLAAVGLTATISAALTVENISANVVAGYFHDHIFVQWDRRFDAMTALRVLTDV